MLLALLGAVPLGEVGDTLANAVDALGQVGLTGRHLRLYLLPKGAVVGGRCDPCGAAGSYHCRQDHYRGLAFYGGARRCHESATHFSRLLLSCALNESSMSSDRPYIDRARSSRVRLGAAMAGDPRRGSALLYSANKKQRKGAGLLWMTGLLIACDAPRAPIDARSGEGRKRTGAHRCGNQPNPTNHRGHGRELTLSESCSCVDKN